MAALGLTLEPESQGLLCSSSCCISILGRPHLTQFQAPWRLVSSCRTHPLGHTSCLGNPAHADPIYSPPQVPGLLSPESHGVQHLQPDHTSSSGQPFPSPAHQGAVRVTGGRPAALTMPEGPALPESSLSTFLSSQGCQGSSALPKSLH